MLISLLLSSYLASTQDRCYLFHPFLQCDTPQRNCSEKEKYIFFSLNLSIFGKFFLSFDESNNNTIIIIET